MQIGGCLHCAHQVLPQLNDKCSACGILLYSSSHETNLAHLKMPDDFKTMIAAKLQEGVSEKKRLDDIRDDVPSQIGLEHLVTLQDIQNIRRQYNIEDIQRHQNDHQSASICVEEMASAGYNPILLYKAQGIEQTKDVDNLRKNDILLCLQTEFQKDMMAKFGSNIICVDATHDTTMYDFLLITVLVMDKYGEGVPVAWALSNREDQAALVVFFRAIKARVGNLSPKILLSDCAEQYYTAWVGVFEGRPEKLLCMWHVDRAWRKKLNEVVPSQEQRVNIYHHLRVLLEETDVSRFNALLQQFLSFLEVLHPTLLDYV